MTLALTALRLQTIEALNSHPVIAALCQGRVYDSRIGDFDHREPVPVIVVTTEELSGEAWNPQNGGAPFDERCDLVLEIAMQALGGTDDDPTIGIPATDRELEAALNLLTECADWIVTLGRPTPRSRPTPAGALLRRSVTRRISKRTVSRFASDQTGEKLAIHLVTYRVSVVGEEIDMRTPPTGDFALLPDPLRTVAANLSAGSSGLLTCQLIANQLALVAPASSTFAQAVVAPPSDPAQQVPGTLPLALTVPIPQGS